MPTLEIPTPIALRIDLEMYAHFLLCGIVDHPNDLDTQSRIDGESLILDVSCAPSDIGKIIGKQGRTARSLRTILGAACRKHGLFCQLNIKEEEGAR